MLESASSGLVELVVTLICHLPLLLHTCDSIFTTSGICAGRFEDSVVAAKHYDKVRMNHSSGLADPLYSDMYAIYILYIYCIYMFRQVNAASDPVVVLLLAQAAMYLYGDNAITNFGLEACKADASTPVRVNIQTDAAIADLGPSIHPFLHASCTDIAGSLIEFELYADA